MSFNDNIHLDPSRVRTSGAGRKIVGAGGGSFLGILLILGFSYLTGIDLTSLISSSAPLHVLVLVVGGRLDVPDWRGRERARRVPHGRHRTVAG